MSVVVGNAPVQPSPYAAGDPNRGSAITTQPNVSAFSWTTNDMTSVKDIITYVQTAQQAAASASDSAVLAEASRQDVLAIKLSYDQTIVKIDQQYIDMVNLANSISTDTTEIQTYVNQTQNLRDEVVVLHSQVSDWRDDIQTYHMMSVYQFLSRTLTTSAETINPLGGSVQQLILNAANTTLSFSPFSDDINKARQLTLFIRQGTGSNTITWPASIRWNNDRLPTLSYISGRVDTITLITFDSGVKWYGFYNGGWFND